MLCFRLEPTLDFTSPKEFPRPSDRALSTHTPAVGSSAALDTCRRYFCRACLGRRTERVVVLSSRDIIMVSAKMLGVGLVYPVSERYRATLQLTFPSVFNSVSTLHSRLAGPDPGWAPAKIDRSRCATP